METRVGRRGRHLPLTTGAEGAQGSRHALLHAHDRDTQDCAVAAATSSRLRPLPPPLPPAYRPSPNPLRLSCAGGRRPVPEAGRRRRPTADAARAARAVPPPPPPRPPPPPLRPPPPSPSRPARSLGPGSVTGDGGAERRRRRRRGAGQALFNGDMEPEAGAGGLLRLRIPPFPQEVSAGAPAPSGLGARLTDVYFGGKRWRWGAPGCPQPPSPRGSAG